MAEVTSLPDGVAFAHACGGRARYSTCRILVTDGLDHCAPRTEEEAALAGRLGLDETDLDEGCWRVLELFRPADRRGARLGAAGP